MKFSEIPTWTRFQQVGYDTVWYKSGAHIAETEDHEDGEEILTSMTFDADVECMRLNVTANTERPEIGNATLTQLRDVLETFHD